MSKWISTTETVLAQLQASTGIPWDKDRFDPDPTTQQLPDTFMCYSLVDDPGTTWTDGKETSHEVRIQINLFYRNQSVFSNIPDQIETAFMAAGFTRGSSGTIPYQEDTELYGWHCDFYFYERR